MRLNKFLPIIFALPYGILWIGGIGTYVFLPKAPQEAVWAAPSFLMLSALIIIFSARLRESFLFLLAGITGFLFEIIGIHTGLPFGSYEYLETIRPSIAGVPLPMISSWIVLPAFVLQLISGLKIHRILKIISSAFVLTLTDLIIDPVALGPMKFWQWHGEGFYYGIPFQNFIGWYIVSTVIFIILKNIDRKNRWHLHIGSSLILFFTIISISSGMLTPSIIGCILFLLYIVRLRFPLSEKTVNKKNSPDVKTSGPF